MNTADITLSTIKASGIIEWWNSEKRDTLKAFIGKQGFIYSLLLDHYERMNEKLDSLSEEEKRELWVESFNFNKTLNVTERGQMCKAIWAMLFLV